MDMNTKKLTISGKNKKDFVVFPFAAEAEETNAYMPSPFGGDAIQEQGTILEQDPIENIDISPHAIAMPTPPPECANTSPVSSHGSSTCVSPQLPASATSDSYIKGSSLEESPVSSPNSICSGDVNKSIAKMKDIENTAAGSPADKELGSEDEMSVPSQGQNVPKNVKLPQRKGGMQLWQFLYALLNDPDRKYNKLIEWTANNLSREFRLLEPEAIAIWWGEHKNKKNMSYDKLSRSLRYYYDKGIIRKISGERYVYQFCIDPELMYKHIGNSDSRPKLKPMPQSAQHATSEYQSQHGFTACSLINKDPCFVAQGPMSLGMMHGHLLPSRSGLPPPHGYPSGMSPYLTHGYSDISGCPELHHPHPPPHLGVYNNNAFYPSTGYEHMTHALSPMTASLGGYSQIEPVSPLKAHLPPLRKSHSYEVPSLTPITNRKLENESYVPSPLLHPTSIGPNSIILSSHTSLSPPPLTNNRVSSPSSPLPPSYSNHSSPHSYPGAADDPLGLDELMTYTSSDDYSVASTLTYQVVHSSSNTSQSQITNNAENTWEEI